MAASSLCAVRKWRLLINMNTPCVQCCTRVVPHFKPGKGQLRVCCLLYRSRAC